MALRPQILWLILGTALVTVLPRVLPMILVKRVRLPGWLVAWLGYVPVAVMAALLTQQVLLPGGDGISLPPENWRLVAILPVLVVTYLTRNVVAAVIVGVLAMTLLLWLLGADS